MVAAVGVQRLDDEHKQYGASAPNLLTQLMPTAVYKLCLYVGAVSNVERKKEKKNQFTSAGRAEVIMATRHPASR